MHIRADVGCNPYVGWSPVLIEYTCTTEWLWSSKYEAEMYGELVQNYCCLEDCGLCGGGAARFNLVRRNRMYTGSTDSDRVSLQPSDVTES